MRIAVGCPIRNRAWVVEEWIEHVRTAFYLAGEKPYWVFAIGLGPNGKDDGTQKLVTDLYKSGSGMWTEINEPEIPKERTWNGERYQQMADYRNRLLDVVRNTQADYFLSLDSDILIHPTGLMCLLETIRNLHTIAGQEVLYDAVGGKTFLSENSSHITSWGNLGPNGGGLRRQDSNGVFPCECIMAIKLMAPTAYNIPYETHRLGEDIGWSLNCNKAGLHLGWDGRVANKHIMKPSDLRRVDQRVGW